MGTEEAAFLTKARAALAARDYRAAHRFCLEALRLNKRAPEAYFCLGVIAAEHDSFEKAAELFERAIAIDPNEARYHAQRAQMLIRLRKESEALAAAERAGDLSTDDALALDTIGVVFSHAGQHQRAIPYFTRAVAMEPRNDRFLHNLGVAQQFAGDFAVAKASFEQELALTPEGRRPYASLVHLSRQSADSNFIEPLERQFAATADPNARLQIGHALAKTYDDLGDFRAAFEWLSRAKESKRKQIGDPTPHLRALFTAALETYSATPAGGFDTSEPIFVIGMPRSGTTLIDRILSSHPDIVSAGEMGHVSRLIGEMTARAAPDARSDVALMRATAKIDVAALGKSYLAAARPRAGGTARFIDKMPINFLYAGLIHRALPNAHVICLRRNPMDVCLANYRQIFAADAAHYWYAYDLAATARYYALFDELIAYWRGALPADRFTEVQYENVVADLEGEARRLVAFCGLPWDERCLAFHENDAPVATASSVQVRSPIYSSSIGRWRRYGEALAPLRQALEEAGIEVGAPPQA